MQRLELYREFANKLIDQRRAYRCYCTRQELAAARETLKKENPKANFVYPGTCRHRTDQPDLPHVVRFNMQGINREATTYRDLVFGEVTTPNSAQQDFVMLRTDGVPLYNFGVVIDDLTMNITLVMRGRDHMVNTPPQILLYEALDRPIPQFAHLPMMLAPSGEKLSKRHGAVSVGDYESNGFVPMGVLNYLARFGWSHGDQEIFARQELIDKFDLEHLGRPDGRFDARKFADVNFEHLKQEHLTDLESYARQVAPFLDKRGLPRVDSKLVRAAIGTIRERARTMVEAAEALDFYLREAPVYDAAAVKKILVPECVDNLEAVAAALDSIEQFDQPAIEAAINGLLASRSLQMKAIAQPARVALTGKTASPGLFELIAVLGRETSVARLRAGIEMARGGRS
jgi:glutamyl-tRNA synthetase